MRSLINIMSDYYSYMSQHNVFRSIELHADTQKCFHKWFRIITRIDRRMDEQISEEQTDDEEIQKMEMQNFIEVKIVLISTYRNLGLNWSVLYCLAFWERSRESSRFPVICIIKFTIYEKRRLRRACANRAASSESTCTLLTQTRGRVVDDVYNPKLHFYAH